jgi:hypothetical protein
MPDEEDNSTDGGAADRRNNLTNEINQEMDMNVTSKMDTSQISSKSIMKDASMLAKNLDQDELQAIAMCFDNIRYMRKENQTMAPQNDDSALGDQFDENLTTMITELAEVMNKVGS